MTQHIYYEVILNPILQTSYLYIGFVFRQIIMVTGVSVSTFTISELKIFGKDDIFTNSWTVNKNGSIYNTSYSCNVGVGTYYTGTYKLNVYSNTNITGNTYKCGYFGINTMSPLPRFTTKMSFSDGNTGGLCIDSSDGNTYNLRLYSYVQASAQVGYICFKLRILLHQLML
jgi:hypothetical protein